MSDRISIVIAEDSLLVRDSVSRALSTDPDVTVVGVAEDYDSAVELVEKHRTHDSGHRRSHATHVDR